MVKMLSTNRIGHKIEKGARYFVSEMSKGGYAPIILLEGTVIAGRTYQAKKEAVTQKPEKDLQKNP